MSGIMPVLSPIEWLAIGIALVFFSGMMGVLLIGDNDLWLEAVLQSVRWLGAGFVIAATADAYLNAEHTILQFAIVIIALVVLFFVEYAVLVVEPDATG